MAVVNYWQGCTLLISEQPCFPSQGVIRQPTLFDCGLDTCSKLLLKSSFFMVRCNFIIRLKTHIIQLHFIGKFSF